MIQSLVPNHCHRSWHFILSGRKVAEFEVLMSQEKKVDIFSENLNDSWPQTSKAYSKHAFTEFNLVKISEKSNTS